MVQQILLALATLGAIAYLGRIIYQSFKAKKSCATGCGKCASSSTHPAS
ncbi:MAG: FeoB-associated Cys-rich membrane protein [Bacteroidetes bacterium]|nr:FeoB-associated Cys-rich membrane protein [Bacteroidota bacterium]